MKNLRPDQRRHLRNIIRDFSQNIEKKYTKGALEHKGNLYDKPCHEYMSDEIIDLFTYLYTHLTHVKMAIHWLENALERTETDPKLANILMKRSYNLLKYGNASGRTEEHEE